MQKRPEFLLINGLFIYSSILIGVHLLNAGWDIIDVQDWLGHKDIKNTAIYGKISNKRREKQFRKLLKSNEIASTLAGIKGLMS